MKMSGRLMFLMFVAAGALSICPKLSKGAEGEKTSPRQIIQELVDKSLTVLRDAKLNADDKTARIQDLAYGRVDFRTVGRLTLGREWQGITAKQQDEFIAEFKKHLSRTYANIGRDYKNQRVEVYADRELPRGDWLVQTRVLGDNNAVTPLDYRLRFSEGKWWIVDMIVEEQSMVLNFRAQFKDILQQGGIDHLIKVLREKNAEAGKKKD